ncbi:MAG: hypothetical protein BGO68_03640 [Candidatus Amoebophilus sp. 36-38]|nr:MAG: hypothetical protein BGO68_03640 [Candidatus Amoebophilus sp. 36-38]
MKNSIKYLRLLSLYGIVGLILSVFGTSQVLGTIDKTSNKQLARNYPGIVDSSLANINLIQENGQVVKPLLDFLALFNIRHDGTVRSINAAMQENFIRKSGLERWDVIDTQEDKRLRTPALRLLRNMELVDAILHFQVNADYFLLFGATIPRAEKRFNDFLAQYNAGTLQCKHIVFLGGVRKLQPSEIERMKVISGISFAGFLKDLNIKETDLTEAHMLRFIWKTKATKRLKDKFQEPKNLFFINSTNITDGANERPTSINTIETWLKAYLPTPGSCHANVEKPYGIRIEKSLRYELEKYNRQLINVKKRFSITWNSSASDPNLLLAIYKDELARTFLTEYNLKKYLGIIKD